MSVVRNFGWVALAARGVLAMAMSPTMAMAEASRAPVEDEAVEQGAVQSSDTEATQKAEERARRWRVRGYWYAVVTVYNNTDQPVTYQIRYTSYGGYYQYTVPAHGWCCHWTTAGSAAYSILVNGRQFAVAPNWVCLYQSPCHHHGRPVNLDVTGIGLAVQQFSK